MIVRFQLFLNSRLNTNNLILVTVASVNPLETNLNELFDEATFVMLTIEEIN